MGGPSGMRLQAAGGMIEFTGAVLDGQHSTELIRHTWDTRMRGERNFDFASEMVVNSSCPM